MKNNSEIYINLFISNEASFEINGKHVKISLATDYPKTGSVKIAVKAEDASFSLNIRIPGFAGDFSVDVRSAKNGGSPSCEKNNGYFCITKVWNDDEVAVSFTIKPRLIHANPRVHQNCGRAAVDRGPEVFCLEEIDNGSNLAALSIDADAPLEECWRDDILGGLMLIKTKGKRLIVPNEPDSFSEKFVPRTEDVNLTLLPYSFWGNRVSNGCPGEMQVWTRIQ